MPYAQHHRKHKGVVHSSVNPDPSDGLFSARNYSPVSSSSFSGSEPRTLRSRLNGQAQAVSPPDGVLTMDSS